MPYTTRADGDVLTASSHNANCRDQVISTVTSATRPAGTEGQIIYETDTDLYQAYTGSGWVPFGAVGAWTNYTPTVTQSGAVTKTVTYARSIKIGRLVIVSLGLAITGAGTANAAITVSTPYTAASTATGNLDVGVGHIFETGVNSNPGIVVLNTTTTFAFLDTAFPTSALLMGQTGTSFASALAAGDAVSLHATYEAAA